MAYATGRITPMVRLSAALVYAVLELLRILANVIHGSGETQKLNTFFQNP